MFRSININNLYRVCCWLWLLFVLITAAGVIWATHKGLRFDSGLLSLLPPTKHSAIQNIAEQRLLKSNGNTVIILLQSKDQQQLNQSAVRLRSLLCLPKSPVVCESHVNKNMIANLVKTYSKHSVYFLSDTDKILARNAQAALLDKRLNQLYGLKPSTDYLDFEQDPLGLFSHFINQQLSVLLPYRYDNGVFHVAKDQSGQFGLFLLLKLRHDDLNLKFQRQFAQWFAEKKQLFQYQFPNVQYFQSGVIFHAIKAADQAKNEIQIISGISIAGIILLFYFSGLGIMPLLLSLLSLALGFLSALIGTQWLFGNTHVLTLVFGASLLGVGIDYAIHFYCHACNSLVSAKKTIIRILPALFLSVASSCIGYAVLAEAPMPGLQQIAFFSIVGLVMSWLTVICLLPLIKLKRKPVLKSMHLLSHAKRFWLAKPQLTFLFIIMVSLASSGYLYYSMNLNEDIRNLYSANKNLMKQEKQIQRVLNAASLGQYILVSAQDMSLLHEKEAVVANTLKKVISKGQLAGYLSLSQLLPNKSQQEENKYLQLGLLSKQGIIAQLFGQLNISESKREKLLLELLAQRQPGYQELIPMLPDIMRNLYLGKHHGQYYSMILLKGITDKAAINALQLPADTVFVDKVQQLSNRILSLQQQLHKQLIFAYLAIMLLLLFRYRKLKACLIVLIPLVSSLLTLSLISLAGSAITLFHSFALFLILGLGMDYAIFLYEYGDRSNDNKTTETAISLSVISSCLAFGLLCLSQTPMISSLGWTILLGSLFNILFTPWVILLKKNQY